MRIRRVAAVAGCVAVLVAGSVTGAPPAAAAAPPPSVSSVDPSSGPTAGKTQVTITGTYFTRLTGVLFGSTPATVRQIASNRLLATAPAGLPGTVNVRVQTASGTSPVTSADRYTYIPTPTITSVSPNTGSTDGGTTVRVTGTEFLSASLAVTFGGVPATILASTRTSVTVTTPAHKAGTVDVRVRTRYGTSEPGDRFTYVSPPVITAISPNIGPTSGGTLVKLTVNNLHFPVTVTFGGVPATLVSSTLTTVTVRTPSHADGVVDARIRTPYGLSPRASADVFTYVAPPTITRLTPNGGGTPGGTQVTVTGTGFMQVLQVTFGGARATVRSNPNPSTLVVMAPSHSQGVVDVQVRTSFGVSAAVPADNYTYVNPTRPVVSSVAPTSGTTRGGTRVTVSGSYFMDIVAVTFGARSAAIVTATGSSVSVIAPQHPAGAVAVRVVTRYGTSPLVAAGVFTYVAPPTITGIEPSSGPSAGGTQVTITGTDLVHVTSVTFGGTAADLVGGSMTSLTVIAPAHAGGAADVRVTTDYGTSPRVAADIFTYIPWPTVTSLSPSTGPTRGGVEVTVTGMNFVDVTSVTFDGVPGVMAPMYFPGVLSVSPPPHAAGVVDVQVTTATGTSPIMLSDRYTYQSGPGWGPSPAIPINLQGAPTSISCPTSDFCVLVDGSNAATYNGTTWSAPSPTGDQDVMSVSCVSSTFCVAVDLLGGTITFNGTSWSPPQGTHIDSLGGLTAVSCTSTSFCVAVDNAGNALTFDGTSWSAPNNIDAMALNAVSCVSSTFCIAVSQDGNALTFNGTSWSTPISLVPMGLTGVTCVSPTFCVAVHAVGEAIMFDGSSWSAPIFIDANGGTTGVSCPSTTFCVAVDSTGLAATFNGTSWSDPQNPVTLDTSPFANLGGVSCASASFCATFGTDNGAVVTFDGANWSAPVKVDNRNGLSGVSCVSPTFCVLVNGNDDAFIWDGASWSQPTNLDSADYFGLSVSCVSSTFCVAVSGIGNAMTYDGSSWSAPVAVAPDSGFSAVSCVSPTFCLAIGGNGQAATFNGTSWSGMTDVGASPQSAVSCASGSFCVVVTNAGEALTFDGTSWSAPVAIDDSPLTGVSCGSESFCVAVDQVGRAVTFDGTGWSAPTGIGSTSSLTAVSCNGSTFCVAVDQEGNALTFNGTSWSAPYPLGIGSSEGSAVSCTSGSFCVAINVASAAMWY